MTHLRSATLPPRTALSLLTFAAIALGVWWVWRGPELPPSARAAESLVRADVKSVELEMTIDDEDSGLAIVVKRKVPVGTTALAALQGTLAVEVKDFPGLGQFVTKISGVAPAKGKFWSATVNGEYSKLGAAEIKLEANTKLAWKTRASAEQ